MKKHFSALCLALLLLLPCSPSAAAESAPPEDSEVVYLDTSPLVIVGALAIITLLRKGGRRR